MAVVKIKTMMAADWEEVKSIYEAGLLTGNASFETVSPGWDNWNKSHLSFGRLVAILDDEVVGWAALSPVSNRCVYGGVAEISVYISAKHRGKGIGKMLLLKLIEESEINGIWTLQAGIFTENIASVKLHENVGFRLVGHREKIGKLNGQWKDNFILERRSQLVGID